MAETVKRKAEPDGKRRKTPPKKQVGLRGFSLFLALLVAFCAGGCCSYVLFQDPWETGDLQGETSAAGSMVAAEEAGESADQSTEDAATEDADAAEETDAESESTSDAETDTTYATAEQILAEMTLDEKIYQMFIVTQEQLTGYSTVTQSGETSKAAIEARPVGGIVYMEQNIQTPGQVTSMISGIQSYSKYGLFIAVDEEGGRVARFGNNSALGTTSFPSMLELGQEGADAVRSAMDTIGTEIGAFGVNLDFAPVADVYTNPDNAVIGSRAFSTDAETAAELVQAAVEGFHESGMLCTLKHFPGHGNTSGDSHTEAVYTYKTLDELREEEFLPFKAGIEAGAEFVMVGHICTPNITDSSTPATLSSTIITDVLREELGFDGIVITDAMNMSAITDYYSSDTAAVKAIQAGVDIILMPANLDAAVSGITDAVESGEITEERIDESVMRILLCKLRQGIITTE